MLIRTAGLQARSCSRAGLEARGPEDDDWNPLEVSQSIQPDIITF